MHRSLQYLALAEKKHWEKQFLAAYLKFRGIPLVDFILV